MHTSGRRNHAVPARNVADPRTGLRPGDEANVGLLAVCPVCGMADGDVGPATWRGWPAHGSCLEWLGENPTPAGQPLDPAELAPFAAVTTLTGMLDGGSLRIRDRTGKLLVTLRLGTPAFAAPVACRGVVKAAARPIEPGVAVAAGRAHSFDLVRSDGAVVFADADAGDLALSGTMIRPGYEVTITAFDIRMPRAVQA